MVTRKKSKILDIACGRTKVPGAVGIDITKLPGIDVVWDLSKFPWPFKKNYFDEIHCYFFLEHCQNLIKTMEELYRILKPSGILFVRVPHYSGYLAWRDPTHKRSFSFYTFDHFDKNHPLNYYSKARFKTMEKHIKWFINYPNEKWYEKNIRPQNYGIIRRFFIKLVQKLLDLAPYYCERYLIYYLGGADEIYVKMKKEYVK